MTPRLFFALVVALAGVLACRSKQAPPSAKAISSAVTRSAPSSAPSPAVSRERVASFVESWRAAQDTSDFEVYRALYAPAFHGVKRAKGAVSRFDRAGWLKDRRELFRLDVKVKVSDLRIFTGERSAVVTFVQDWSTPRFHDVGPKRLELVLHGDRLLITNEEMLESTPASVPAVSAPPPEELALLWPLGRGFGVVLRQGPVETRGPARKVMMSKSSSDFLLEKDVADVALRPFEAFRGRMLDLYGPKGVLCAASVTSFRAIGGFSSWDADEPAEDVWRALGDAQFLVAVVEPGDPACQPLWARASDLRKPTILEPRELTQAEAELAAEALRKTKTARDTQASYVLYRDEGGQLPDLENGAASGGSRREVPARWEDLEPKHWRALGFTHPESGASYFAAELAAGEGCGSFAGYALGFFKAGAPDWLDLTGNGSPGLELPGRPLFGLTPLAAVALEPGGPIFLVGDNVLYANAGAGFAPVTALGRYRTTCSC